MSQWEITPIPDIQNPGIGVVDSNIPDSKPGKVGLDEYAKRRVNKRETKTHC